MTWSVSVRTRAVTGMLSCIAVLLWCTAARPSGQSGVPVQMDKPRERHGQLQQHPQDCRVQRYAGGAGQPIL
jgi:hypothetical protein